MFKKFNGLAYRSHDPKWSFKPESGLGAKKFGGRFNRKGVPALYLSLNQMGALLESQQGFSNKAQPKLICTYNIETSDIVDLSTPEMADAHDIIFEKLACAWMLDNNPYTHQISDTLLAKGASGIISPSYASGAKDCLNLVLWKWSNKLPYKVLVVDDNNALPKNQLSWK